MFTGLIEETGVIENIRKDNKYARILIRGKKIFEKLYIGDSVAVNGICLTAAGIHGVRFTADIMTETLKRSSLHTLEKNSLVNLERAMPADGRFGGHIVSGHIDGTGILSEIKKEGHAVWYTVRAKPEIMCQIVEKGSIAIDGISLTVTSVKEDYFNVSVIPHTSRNTIINQYKVNQIVNLETDILGKYVERILTFDKSKNNSTITNEFLLMTGFH